MIITGESGAGKTVTTQRLIQFLCNTSSKRKHIMEGAFNALRIMDIFRNAETPENRSSSWNEHSFREIFAGIWIYSVHCIVQIILHVMTIVDWIQFKQRSIARSYLPSAAWNQPFVWRNISLYRKFLARVAYDFTSFVAKVIKSATNSGWFKWNGPRPTRINWGMASDSFR